MVSPELPSQGEAAQETAVKDAAYWRSHIQMAVEVRRPEFVGREPELGTIAAVIEDNPQANLNGVQIEDHDGNLYLLSFVDAEKAITIV
jgi:hypothetical protein